MPDTPLMLYDSLSRSLRPFEPIDRANVRVYTCGPTVYNFPHIGNMRAYVFADTLGRVLRWKGYGLTHVINITDVGHLTDDADAGEDKLERAASERAQSIWDIARHYTEAFWADCKALNITEPAHWSIATDYVPKMIAFAESVAEKHCYLLSGGLYFDTSTVAGYGRLARAATDAGEGRIESVEGKRHPQDFAIWRRTPPGETRQMEWDSPWGRGAPGWHLECSVMSEALLGLPFDIHTGGIDHREIHHPNEIAQNQARCGGDGTGANWWMHNNFLIDRAGKMSKSSGEFLRLQLLIDRGVHPLAYRLMCLQAHYRSELEFSWEGLGAALTRLKRMVMAVRQFEEAMRLDQDAEAFLLRTDDLRSADVPTRELLDELDAAVSNDLNTPQALAVIETALSGGRAGGRIGLLTHADGLLGLELHSLTRADLRIRPVLASLTDDDVEARLAERKAARAAKDFGTSDRIRDELNAAGVEIMDGDPLGWEWRLDLS